MFDIVEAVVDEELEFGDDAQLLAHSCAEVETDLLLVGIIGFANDSL